MFLSTPLPTNITKDKMSNTHISDLTIETALEVCCDFPEDDLCVICQETLRMISTNDKRITDTYSSDDEELTVVVSKVCGFAHYFHRRCILSWFKSQVPYLNTCPVDRKVLFGTQPIQQRYYFPSINVLESLDLSRVLSDPQIR